MRTTRIILGIAIPWLCQSLSPAWGQVPTNTRTVTNTFTNTMTNTPAVSHSNTPTPSSTGTFTNTPTLTKTNTATATFWTHTSTPTNTTTWTTHTSTPTSTATNTLTNSPTMTPTPFPYSNCVTLGTNDPAPVITITIPANGYLSNVIPIGSTYCGNSVSLVQAFVGNPSPYPQYFDVGIYDNLTKVGSVSILAPANTWGWLSLPVTTTPLSCGDSLILSVHNQGPTILYLGASSAGLTCAGDSGSYSGVPPGTYPNAAALAAAPTNWCYEVNVLECGATFPGPSTPTITTTPTFTPTPWPATDTPTPTPPACGFLGYADQGPVSLVALPLGQYVANVIYDTGSACGATLTHGQVYLSNTDSSAEQAEVAVYDGSFSESMTVTVPGSFNGWLQGVIPSTGPLSSCGNPMVLAVHSLGASLSIGVSPLGPACYSDSGTIAGPMPASYPNPAILATPVAGLCYEAGVSFCGGGTNTPTPFPSWTPTPTPGTGGSVTIIYNNPASACSGAFGCSIEFVNECRALNLDFATSYLIMRLGATCGCRPSDIMQLRLTMGWDEICAHYGFDWATFTADLQTRIDTLQPEIDTPNMIMRTAANDPSQYPIEIPTPMPDTLPTGTTSQENCPLCQ